MEGCSLELTCDQPQKDHSRSRRPQQPNILKLSTNLEPKFKQGVHDCCKPMGAGCDAASIRRAGAIHRMQENDRNSLNTPPIAETLILADS